MTFDELTAQALDVRARPLAELTQSTYRTRLGTLRLAFGDRDLTSITRSTVELLLAELAKRKKWRPATINGYLTALTLVFSWGVSSGVIAANPCAGIAWRRTNNARKRCLDDDEEARLRSHVKPANLPELELVLNTGLRRGEQFALKRRDVDMQRKLLVVVWGKGGRRREIPLNEDAMAAIRAFLGTVKPPGPDDFLCRQHRRGGKRDGSSWFEDAVKAAEIPDFRWHDLRHTFATRLNDSGVDLPSIQYLLGHSSLAMTSRYAHPGADHMRSGVERLMRRTEQGKLF